MPWSPFDKQTQRFESCDHPIANRDIYSLLYVTNQDYWIMWPVTFLFSTSCCYHGLGHAWL